MKQPSKVIVHVARNAVAANVKNGTAEPTIIVRRGRRATRHHAVDIVGPARVVSAFDGVIKPLPCGARVWITCSDARPVEVVSDEPLCQLTSRSLTPAAEPN